MTIAFSPASASPLSILRIHATSGSKPARWSLVVYRNHKWAHSEEMPSIQINGPRAAAPKVVVKGPIRCHKCNVPYSDAEQYLAHPCKPGQEEQ